MKILFISRAYSDKSGGMERLSFELINSMKKIDGVEVEAITQEQTNFQASFVGKLMHGSWFMFKIFPQAVLAARRADVVHLGDPLLSKLGWFIKLLSGKPVAVMVHGLDVTFPNPLYQLYLKMFFRRLDLFLPISQHAKELLTSKHPGLASHSTVINPGMTDRYYDPSVTREKLQALLPVDYSLPPDAKFLLTVGRLVKRKGHAWFVKNVFPELPKNVIYLVVGDGPSWADISHAGRATPGRSEIVSDQLIMLGRLSSDDLKTLYNTVDAFVQPSVEVEGDAEGFGLVLLEAALCNRPVFASDLEGMKDAVTPGKNGTLLPSENATAWITELTSFLSHNQVTSDAREFTLEKFNWSKQAQAYKEALATVVNK